jgi:ribonuclease PH
MQEILVATGNSGKIKEYQKLLADLPIKLLSLQDVNLANMDVDENADTFEGNAILKAKTYAHASGKITIADDSGLCVDALGGAPGVHSSRYAGDHATDADRRNKVLAQLRDVPPAARGAYFMCVIALFDPDTDELQTVSGRCDGTIAIVESTGQNGFGYDPIFIPQGYDLTYADLPHEVKHQSSHRGRAVQALIPILSAL